MFCLCFVVLIVCREHVFRLVVAAGLAANTKAAPEMVTLHNAAKQSAFAALNVKYFGTIAFRVSFCHSCESLETCCPVLAGGLDRLTLLLSPAAFCGSLSWWAAVPHILDAFTGVFSYLTAESTLKMSAAVVAALSQCIGQLTGFHCLQFSSTFFDRISTISIQMLTSRAAPKMKSNSSCWRWIAFPSIAIRPKHLRRCSALNSAD
jgi:hypothetical protein